MLYKISYRISNPSQQFDSLLKQVSLKIQQGKNNALKKINQQINTLESALQNLEFVQQNNQHLIDLDLINEKIKQFQNHNISIQQLNKFLEEVSSQTELFSESTKKIITEFEKTPKHIFRNNIQDFKYNFQIYQDDLLQNIEINMQSIIQQNFLKDHDPKQITELKFIPDRGYELYGRTDQNNIYTGIQIESQFVSKNVIKRKDYNLLKFQIKKTSPNLEFYFQIMSNLDYLNYQDLQVPLQHNIIISHDKFDNDLEVIKQGKYPSKQAFREGQIYYLELDISKNIFKIFDQKQTWYKRIDYHFDKSIEQWRLIFNGTNLSSEEILDKDKSQNKTSASSNQSQQQQQQNPDQPLYQIQFMDQ